MNSAGAPDRTRPSGLLIAGGLLVCVVLFWYLAGRDTARQTRVGARPPIGGPAAAPDRLDKFHIPPASVAPLPRSLSGTSVDGGFSVDAAGRFVPDEGTLRLFNFFFSASGEESDQTIRGRILLYAMTTGLADPTVTQIAGVLDRYIAFRDAVRASALSSAPATGDGRAGVAQLRELQRRILGADLQNALYGADTTAIDLDLDRMAVLRNSNIGIDEQQRLLAAIEAREPTEVRAARAASAMPAQLHARVEMVRAAGGSEADVAEARRAMVGDAAAERLEALDREHARWQERVAQYRRERDALASSFGNSDGAAYRSAVAALRRRHFVNDELARIEAWDAAGLP